MSELSPFDRYLKGDGPAALVIREPLMPVEGADGVFFPPTFAAGDGFPGGYNIDPAIPKQPQRLPDRLRGVASEPDRADLRGREV